MEIQIVKFFQSLANGFNDVFFYLVTKMGEETFFLLTLGIVYLCYSDKFAIKLTFYYLASVAFNNIIKLVCRRPRPYLASSEIADRLHAKGYSFPSGHTQGFFVLATTNMLEINNKSKRKSFKISALCVLSVLGILVMVSRMYWGQHYLTDVLVGMMFGIAVPFFLNFLFGVMPDKIKNFFSVDRLYNIVSVCSVVVAITAICLQFFAGKTVDLLYKFSAVFIVMAIGYFINKNKIRYMSNQGFKVGILKALIMLVSVIGLYALINLIFDIYGVILFVVYLFLGAICTIILPILFKLIFKKGYDNGQSNN